MKKLFAILIMCSLSVPVIAGDLEEAIVDTPNSANIEETAADNADEMNSSVQKETDTAVSEELPSKFKEPVSKKALAKKFIIAMLCVAGTSIFLYGSLSIYNKLKESLFLQANLPPEGETPLASPSDLSEAVKTFVDKTNWNN